MEDEKFTFEIMYKQIKTNKVFSYNSYLTASWIGFFVFNFYYIFFFKFCLNKLKYCFFEKFFFLVLSFYIQNFLDFFFIIKHLLKSFKVLWYSLCICYDCARVFCYMLLICFSIISCVPINCFRFLREKWKCLNQFRIVIFVIHTYDV